MSTTASSSRILIVDDDPQVRSILMRCLEADYPECIDTHSPFDALHKIKNDHFDLIISDVMMPGMSGTELLRLVRKNDPETAVIIVTGAADIGIAVDSLRLGAFDFLPKPFDLLSVRHAVRRALERRQLLIKNRYYQEELEKEVWERTRELNTALEDVEESYRMSLEALANVLDAREHETHGHSRRVREYTSALARIVGLSDGELIHVGRGALLHDVGKIGVPDSILLKPGKLTEAEWIKMKEHPRIGFEILREIQFLEPAAQIVLAHQERWDGKGYPAGLSGDQIPLGSRLFAVVDTLDAMTSDRPYRKAMSYETALAEVRRCSGTQFDPRVVEAFLSVPSDFWKQIHDAVNSDGAGQERFDILCRT